MSMSDDPRYRRGQGAHQRQPAQPNREGRPERSSAPQRGIGQPDGAPDRDGGRHPSFSAYRPEAYAAPEKGSQRQDWDAGRGPAARPQSPAADAYPRPAPERPSPQSDPRDPYRSAADPYAAPPRDYDAGWQGSYPEPGKFNSGGLGDSNYPDSAGKYPNYFEEPPQTNDAQAVHDRFFAPEPEPDPAVTHYRGVVDRNVVDYGEQPYDGGQPGGGYGGYGDSAFAGSQPQQRTPYPGDPAYPAGQDYTWENYDQAPPPASLRPYQQPAAGREDDLDADFFADEDEFENEDYQEGKGSGRKKLMAAVLAGAVVTGLGLGFLYKSGSRGGDGEPAMVAADTTPVKEAPQSPGGKQIAGSSKLIHGRLGGYDNDETHGTTLASAEAQDSTQDDSPAVITTTGGGSVEDRIENALREARGPEHDAGESGAIDAPHRVRTVHVNPDGSIANDAGAGSTAHQIEAPRTESTAAPVVITSSEETADEIPPATSQRVAYASPQGMQVSESPGGTGNYFVQVGARNVQEEAIKAFAAMQQKYAAVLGNYSPVVRKVDLGEKGIWYRLRVGPFDNKSSADTLCEDLKTAGWKQCFSVKD